jgi:hypothetical protein
VLPANRAGIFELAHGGYETISHLGGGGNLLFSSARDPETVSSGNAFALLRLCVKT